MSEDTKRYQCRHIFTDGRRCGSPCLRREEVCYYHHTTRRPIENPGARRTRPAQCDLALPEDRSAIQCSIGEVLRRIARNEIDSKRAGLLLYGLQIASLNLPRNAEPARDAYPVEEITADPRLGTLAPRIEVGKAHVPEERLTTVGRLLRGWPLQEAKEKEEEKNKVSGAPCPDSDNSGQPEIEKTPVNLPTLQATEAQTSSAACSARLQNPPRKTTAG